MIYDELVKELGEPKPTVPTTPTKRDRHKAGQTTREVWAGIETEHVRDDNGRLLDVKATLASERTNGGS